MLKTLVMAALIAVLPATATDPHPAKLVGNYDGGQMEMAAGLSLKADGRFGYGCPMGQSTRKRPAHGPRMTNECC